MWNNRIFELLAVFMVGDGILGMLFPERHSRLWKFGPPQMQHAIEQFAENPTETRIMSAIEILLGLVLAAKQHNDAGV